MLDQTNVEVLAGPPLLGYVLNWFFYGVLSIQVSKANFTADLYYLTFHKDKWFSKALVIFIYVVETVQTVIMTGDCWTAYAKGFGDVSGLGNVENEWLAAPILTAIVSCVVQTFYAYRIFILSGRSHYVWFIVALSVLQLIGGLITGAQSIHAVKWSNLESHPHVNEGLWLGATVLADVVIAASMVYLLKKPKIYSSTIRNIVSKLTRMVIETGTLTAVVAILTLILFYQFPNKPIHSTPMDVLAKTYSVSVMAIFNSRIKLSADLEEVPSGVTSVLRFASATKDTNFASYEMSVSGTNSTLQTDTEQQIVEPKRPRDDEEQLPRDGQGLVFAV